jgi:hypothetical protein
VELTTAQVCTHEAAAQQSLAPFSVTKHELKRFFVFVIRAADGKGVGCRRRKGSVV